MEDIFISEVNEQNNLAIVIEGDEHSVWAYLMQTVDEEQKLILDGFICSRGTTVKDTDELKSYIANKYAPPLIKDYLNEFSIHESLKNEDLEIQWDDGEVRIFLDKQLYLLMDLSRMISFSKAISKSGPYGFMFDDYDL